MVFFWSARCFGISTPNNVSDPYDIYMITTVIGKQKCGSQAGGCPLQQKPKKKINIWHGSFTRKETFLSISVLMNEEVFGKAGS